MILDPFMLEMLVSSSNVGFICVYFPLIPGYVLLPENIII